MNFTSLMENLASSTTCHARAYAINTTGVGYGHTVEFTTGNAAPTATSIAINGATDVSGTLTESYRYLDAENDIQGVSTFQPKCA